jgi:hypothetical protein
MELTSYEIIPEIYVGGKRFAKNGLNLRFVHIASVIAAIKQNSFFMLRSERRRSKNGDAAQKTCRKKAPSPYQTNGKGARSYLF